MKHSEIKELFAEYSEAEARNRALWLDDLKFGFASDQWTDGMRREREQDPHGMRPCLTVNKIPTHARQIINNMRQARASIKVLPVDDQADVETAEVLNGIIRHIEHISNAEQAYSLASEYQVMMGIGYFRIDCVYENSLYNEQSIAINLIRNPFTVYMDPWITDITGADSNACFVTSMISEREYKRAYPKAKNVDIEVAGRGDSGGWFSDKSIKVAEFFSLEDAKVTYLFAGGVPYSTDKYDSERHGPVEREAEVTEKECHWQLLNGEDIIEERTKPGKYIPVVRVAGEDYDIDGEREVHGIVRRCRDAQQIYNFTASANAEHNALQPKAPWLVAEESIEGHEEEFASANRTNHPFLTYSAFSEEGNPIPPPQRQFPTGSNSGLLAQLQTSDGDIQSTIGQFAASLGQPSNEKSGIAIRQRQQVGDISTFHYADNMGRAIKQAGRIIVDLIPKIYDTARAARILGEDGDASKVSLNPEISGAYEERESANGKIEKIYNVGVGTYDVAVTVGPSFNTKRQEAFEAMAQITQGNPQLWAVIGDLLIKSMDWPGAQEMADRIKATIPPEIRGKDDEEEQMDPEVAAKFQELAQVVEQLGGQNQELAETNQKLKGTIDQKLIEQQMKQDEFAYKRDELSFKQSELASKREEVTAQLVAQADRNENEFQSMSELVGAAHLGAQQSTEILAALAQAQQQNGEILSAMLEQMAKPKVLSVEMDAEGNVIGGVSRAVD